MRQNRIISRRAAALALLFCVMLCCGCGRQQPVTYALGEAPAAASAGTHPGGRAAQAEQTVSAAASASAVSVMQTGGTEAPSEEAQEICVYVCGAVRKPGVYMLPAGSRVYAALEAAGGLLPEADPRQINQAELLADGQQITIYTEEDLEAMPSAEAAVGADGRVNINTAGTEELMTLPGIGQVRAEAIVRWREEHGAFASIEEITQVEGIKEASFRKISDRICI